MYELRNSSDGEIEKTIVKTYDYWVETSDGTKYLDIQSGNSAYMLGYNNQEVINAISDKLKTIAFLRGNTGETDKDTSELVSFILSESGMNALSWAISGSSAVECAININDTYWKFMDPVRNLIVSFTPSYHGTTYFTRALANPLNIEFPSDRIRGVKAPVWKNIDERESVEEESLTLLKKRLTKFSDSNNIGAIIMETVPWMHNILPYSLNWWLQIRKLCNEFKINFITDDVAVCFGKSLSYFGYTTAGFNIQPDIIACGKATTAGYAPLGFAVCNERIGTYLKSKEWEWGHTWQPYTAGIAAMKKTIEIIKRDSLFTKGDKIAMRLNELGKDMVAAGYSTGYRASGLFLAIDLKRNFSNSTIGRLLRSGMISTTQHPQSIKIIAPLIADDLYFNELRARLKDFLSKQ